MEPSTDLTAGLGNLDREQRHAIYRDLREALGVSDSEPMLPLPAAELLAWSRRFAEIMSEEFGKRPATRALSDRAVLEAGLLAYGQPASDAFLDSQLAFGPALHGGGLAGIYLHSVANRVALAGAVRAAREVLPAASAALVEERYPSVVLLRHGLFQEGYFGTTKLASSSAPA